MEFDRNLVQDFDEDIGYASRDQEQETGPKVVPTFYSDVYTHNERLDFQNRQPQHAFDFNSEQPIHITRTVNRIMPSTTVRKSKSKGKGKKRPTGTYPVSMKKKRSQNKPGLKKKTYKAYMGEYKKEGQENKDWNFDTKGTGGYFDKSLRKQVITYPLREKEDIVEDIKIKSPSKIRQQREERVPRGRSAKSHRPNYEEGKKNYYTDLDEFNQHILHQNEGFLTLFIEILKCFRKT